MRVLEGVGRKDGCDRKANIVFSRCHNFDGLFRARQCYASSDDGSLPLSSDATAVATRPRTSVRANLPCQAE
jgi:hypothetical protein